MPKIETAEDAVNIAEKFLLRYYSYRILQKVTQDLGKWVVEFDVSILGPKEIVRIKLDADTGSVIEYTKV